MPEVVDTDRGSQFTGQAFTGVFGDDGIAISMDGTARAPGWTTCSPSGCGAASNVGVYRRAYESVGDPNASIADFRISKGLHRNTMKRTVLLDQIPDPVCIVALFGNNVGAERQVVEQKRSSSTSNASFQDGGSIP
jgi:hypothetical protein